MIVTNTQQGSKTSAGDEARFNDLYARHRSALHRYCARRTDPSRVDDAVAETFLVAWRKLGDVPDTPSSWRPSPDQRRPSGMVGDAAHHLAQLLAPMRCWILHTG